jgi:hypothetical protein
MTSETSGTTNWDD